MSSSYSVHTTEYAERYYIKRFKKKYKKRWDITRRAIEEELKRVDMLLSETSIVEIITESEDILICKSEFKIAGTNQSRRGSGNRCVVAVHQEKRVVHILLVYHKNDLSGRGGETTKWKRIIKDQYPEYREIL